VSVDPFRRYREDPVAFVQEVLGVHLYSRQREIIEAVRDHERVAVKSGNATGKTCSAACAILAWLAGGPGSVVVSTSATEAQLRRVLWRETRRRFKQARGFFDGAVVTETEIRLREDWYATGFSTDTPEAMQGIHAERVLVVVDEGSGVEEPIFDSIEGLLAAGDARVLLIGNPLRTSGSFYDAFHSRRDEWHTISVSAFDTPAFTGEQVPRALRRNLVSKRWVQRMEKRGAGSNELAVRVLGEFPSQQDDAVVSRADLEAAQVQTLEPGLPLVLGLDVARFGSDESVLALREGNRIRVIDAWQGKAITETTGRVLDHVRRLQAEHARRIRVVVDDAGLGGGATDGLREQGVQVVAFNGGGKARRPGDYPNRRSELWFTFAEALPLLDLDGLDEELARELLAPSFSFESSGARVVEQKANTRKRLRRSPDRADAVLLCLAVEPPVVPGRARKRRGLSWAKGSLDELGRFAGHPRPRLAAAGRVKIGGERLAPRSFAAGTPSVPLPGEVPLDERLGQLGVPVSDSTAARYSGGLFGGVTEHMGAPHPDLVEGGETPKGASVTRAASVVERIQGDGGDDRHGTVWNG
jgi:phage terminase large subunit